MVSAAVRTRVAEVTGDAVWDLAPGGDIESRTFFVGGHVVKVRHLRPFLARIVCSILADVHDGLRGSNLAPDLRLLSRIDDTLVSVHDRLDPVGVPEPGEIGDALARAHWRLSLVAVGKSYPWLGFYGEHAEFAAIVTTIEDDDLRADALAVLPAARRIPPSDSAQYVHRDLHHANVLRTSAGVSFIDWELAHIGQRLDDTAMALCCLAPGWPLGRRKDAADEFMDAYRRRSDDARVTLGDPRFRAAIAVSGLRQGVAAWFTDDGDDSHAHWPAVRRRLRVARELVEA